MATEQDAPIDLQAVATPAVHVNKFQVLVSGQTLRLAAAESVTPEATFYRVALVMNLADARDLANAILDTVKRATPMSGGLLSPFTTGGTTNRQSSMLPGSEAIMKADPSKLRP